MREDRLDLVSRLRAPVRRAYAGRSHAKAARAAAHGRGGRSTSPSRPACPWRPRSRRTRAERVLQRDHGRLRGRQLGEARAELPRVLGRRPPAPGRRRGRRARPRPAARAARELRSAHVLAGVDDEAVEPGRELRFAAELAYTHDELRERLLRSIARVLRVAEQVQGELLDPRRMPFAERCQRRASPSFARVTKIGSESLS